MEVRELLSKYECRGDHAPVGCVSSVRGHGSERWRQPIAHFLAGVEAWMA
jgi:translation elongation factor EF-Tu-like GTPase